MSDHTVILIADILRWAMILLGCVASGAGLWRIIHSPLRHQRLLSASTGLFSLTSIVIMWRNLGTYPTIWLAAVGLLGVVLGVWGLWEWDRLEQNTGHGSFGKK